MVMVILFARFWFDVPMAGSAPLLLAASSVFLLSTLGIGLFISTVSRTQSQAMMTNFFFILPFFMLSGFVFPIANMPVAVQWLTHLNPLSHFLVIIRGIFLKGTGFAVLWPQFLELTVLGWRRVRRRHRALPEAHRLSFRAEGACPRGAGIRTSVRAAWYTSRRAG